jgi:hypothetical protein
MNKPPRPLTIRLAAPLTRTQQPPRPAGPPRPAIPTTVRPAAAQPKTAHVRPAQPPQQQRHAPPAPAAHLPRTAHAQTAKAGASAALRQNAPTAAARPAVQSARPAAGEPRSVAVNSQGAAAGRPAGNSAAAVQAKKAGPAGRTPPDAAPSSRVVQAKPASRVIQMVKADLYAGSSGMSHISDGADGVGKRVSSVDGHAERQAWQKGKSGIKVEMGKNLGSQLDVLIEVDKGVCHHCQLWMENVVLGTLHQWDTLHNRTTATRLFIEVKKKSKSAIRRQVVRGTTDWSDISYTVESIRTLSKENLKQIGTDIYG